MRMCRGMALILSVAAMAAAPPAASAAPVAVHVSGTTELAAISCPPTGPCVAAGFGAVPFGSMADGMTVTVGDHVGVPQPVPGITTSSGTTVPLVGSLNGISCPRSCVAIGPEVGFLQGGAVPVVAGHPGAVIAVPNLELAQAIDCASVDRCLAAGGETLGAPPLVALVPLVRGVPGSVFGPPFVIGVLQGVSCRAGVCWAVGSTQNLATGFPTGALVRTTGGISGPLQTAPVGNLPAVSCPVADTCLAAGTAATGGTGVVVPISAGVVGAAEPVAGTSGLSAVACANASQCVAVGEAFVAGPRPEGVAVPVIHGVAGKPMLIPGTSDLLGVACRASSCVAVGVQGDSPNRVGVVVTSLSPG